jgi:hypothetical protein
MPKTTLHSAKTKAKPIIAKTRTIKRLAAKLVTKELVISAIQAAARKLDHGPSGRELKQMSGITASQVARRFGTYRAAVFAAGVKPHQAGVRVEAAILLEDWGRVARKLGRMPSNSEYERAGGYSRVCFTRSFQSWVEVPAAFSRFVASGGLGGDWTDVLEMVREGPMPTCGKCGRLAERRAAMKLASEAEARKAQNIKVRPETYPRTMSEETRQLVAGDDMRQPRDVEPREIASRETTGMAILPPPLWGKKCVTATMLAVFVAELAPSGLQWVTGALFPRRAFQDRPLMGALTKLPGLAHEPLNEMGVLVLFAMLSRQLGFIIDAVQAGFPDLLVRIEVQPGRWQYVRVEVEYESRNFKRHGHDALKCDLIVCWRHNWKNCPPNLQVLELSKVVEQLVTGQIS